MDIHISTSEPEAIDAEGIAEAIEALNYFVANVYVNDVRRWTFWDEEDQ